MSTMTIDEGTYGAKTITAFYNACELPLLNRLPCGERRPRDIPIARKSLVVGKNMHGTRIQARN